MNFTAVIDEEKCIGCTKCIQACPVDAIIGARKQAHTVIIDHCIGCKLCLPPCPIDCIELIPKTSTELSEPGLQKQLNKARALARKKRLAIQPQSQTATFDPKQLLQQVLDEV